MITKKQTRFKSQSSTKVDSYCDHSGVITMALKGLLWVLIIISCTSADDDGGLRVWSPFIHPKCYQNCSWEVCLKAVLSFCYHHFELREYCTPNQKLACLCSISNLSTLFGKLKYALHSHLSRELKNGVEILVGQAIFKLWIKTAKVLFGSIIQEPLGLPKF